MKKLTSIAIIALASTIGFVSCKKNDVPQQQQGVISSMDDFFTRNGAPTQVFTITDVAVGQTFTGSKGTIFTVPANAFVKADGSAVSGAVTVEVRELLTKADLVLSNKPTISSGLPLESGGSWLFQPKQGTDQLRIAPNKKVNMNIPRGANELGDMFLFNAPDAGNKAVNWGEPRRGVDANGQTGDVMTIVPLSTPINNYFCGLDSVGWGNADRFMTNPDYATGTTINVDNYGDYNNATGFFLYTGKKIVWPLMRGSSTFVDAHIAKNQPGTLVVFEIINGNLYVATKSNVTITGNNEVHNLHMTQMTEADFKTFLQGVL